MSLALSHDLLRCLPLPDRAKDDLSRRMMEPWRQYHTRQHLDLLWRRHLCHRSSTAHLDQRLEELIALAIAYHDAVYVGGAKDNEIKSAALWLEVSGAVEGLGEDERLWVMDTILATADHVRGAAALDLADRSHYARQWVLDLDLTPLGESPEVFDSNMALLAAEVPHLGDDEQRGALLAGLRHFETAQPLYRCTAIADAFERPARDNLHRHLAAPASSSLCLIA